MADQLFGVLRVQGTVAIEPDIVLGVAEIFSLPVPQDQGAAVFSLQGHLGQVFHHGGLLELHQVQHGILEGAQNVSAGDINLSIPQGEITAPVHGGIAADFQGLIFEGDGTLGGIQPVGLVGTGGVDGLIGAQGFQHLCHGLGLVLVQREAVIRLIGPARLGFDEGHGLLIGDGEGCQIRFSQALGAIVLS